jgi:hypothetical protein
MDELAVRDHAKAYCDALLAGNIGKATEELSSQLRSNLGPIVAMLPLPLTVASIESVETTATGYRAVLRLVGEGGTINLETRWKDRDGRPTMVEASRVHEEPIAEVTQADSTEDQEESA